MDFEHVVATVAFVIAQLILFEFMVRDVGATLVEEFDEVEEERGEVGSVAAAKGREEWEYAREVARTIGTR